jgi:hypothetical protein
MIDPDLNLSDFWGSARCAASLGFYRVRTELVYYRAVPSTAISLMLGNLYSELLL